MESPRRRRFGADGNFSGDLAMSRLQQQLSLHPDKAPEPPFDEEESLLPLTGRIAAVAAVAAAVAWVMISIPGARLMRNDAKSADNVSAAIEVSADKSDVGPAATALLVQHGLASATFQPQSALPNMAPQMLVPQPLDSPVSAPPFATPLPAAPNIADPPANGASLALDREEVVTLVKRGQDFLTNGDLAAARLLLRRAAMAGSADAALALGASYDPLVLRRLGAIGARPDTAQAREWYQKAAALGSQAASQQLAKLELASQ
jgi:hypothetical protein